MDASNNTRERVDTSTLYCNEDVVVSMLMDIASNGSGPREAESRTWPVVLKYDCTPSFTNKICTAMCEAHRQGKLSKELAATMCALVVNAMFPTSTLPGPGGGPCLRASDVARLDDLDVKMDTFSGLRRYHDWSMEDRMEVITDPPKDPEYWRLAKEQFIIARGNFEALPTFNPYRANPRTRPSSIGDHISVLKLADLSTLHRSFLELDMSEQLARLRAKIREECGFVRLEAYIDLLLPYLGAVVKLLQARNLPLDRVGDREMFVDVLGSYILRYVQREPAQPKDWQQTRREGCAAERLTDCDCSICDDVNSFLQSDRQTQRFAYNIPERAHLERRLGLRPKAHSEDADYITSTEKHGGTPHRLVVKKTHKAFRRKHDRWALRGEEIRGRILQLIGCDTDLRTLLGEDYERVMSCRSVRDPESELVQSKIVEADRRAIFAGDPTCLLHLGEPQRTKQWLQLCFVQEPEAHVPEKRLIRRYRDSFAPVVYSTCDILTLDELSRLVVAMFPGVTIRDELVHEFGDPLKPVWLPERYKSKCLKGLRELNVKCIGNGGLEVGSRVPLSDITGRNNVAGSTGVGLKRKCNISAGAVGSPAKRLTVARPVG
ncbi:hypothetical protein LTR49_024274 [Elasticomyces elasticus]|nr:hypothetical protein LTR49_024274 [Elasticomyces elasticus]